VYMGPHWLAQHAHAKYIMGWSIVYGSELLSYVRMLFGLMGAPSTFAEMTAQALGDLVGILFELFINDGGMAGDDFTETLANIRTLLTRVMEKGLSLSAAKSSFFMTEAV
jgi:hypothetical protein